MLGVRKTPGNLAQSTTLCSLCVLSVCPSAPPSVCSSARPHSMPFRAPKSRQRMPFSLVSCNACVTLGQKVAAHGARNHDCAGPVVGGPQGSRKLRPIRYLFSFCVLSVGPSLCPYVCPSGCPCAHRHSMPFGDPQSRQYGPLVLGARTSRVTLGQKMAIWGRNHESATQSLGSRNFQGSFAQTTFHVVFARRPSVCPSVVFAEKRLFALIDVPIITPFFVVRVNRGEGTLLV